MASVVNGSFSSPLANADFPTVSDGGLLSRVYNGMTGLSVFVTFLLILVAYDQCELLMLVIAFEPWDADFPISHVHMEQRIDCGARVENAICRTFLVVGVPQNGRVQSKVREWRIELRLGVP